MQKEREKRDQQGKKKSSALRLFLLCSHFPPQREIHCFHSVVFPERGSRSLLLSDVITRYSPTPRLSIHKQSKKSAQNRTIFTHCFGRLKFFVAYYFTPFSEDSAMGRTKRKREQKKDKKKYRMAPSYVIVTVAIVLCLCSSTSTATEIVSDPFYASWMGHLGPLLHNFTLLDLSLPGTHDTFTYDLSTSVADHANDLSPVLAELLHNAHTELEWLAIGDFMRNQSRAQGLTITEQLNAGSRFVDFRNTWTAPPGMTTNATNEDWYGVHFCQTQQPSWSFWLELYEWIVAHPTELIVVWISKHGDNCGTTYDGIPLDAMQSYWHRITTLFGPLLFNTTFGTRLNETTIGELLQRDQRVVLYASDYANFTGGGSAVAMNDCLVDNEGCGDVTNLTDTVFGCNRTFQNVPAHLARTKGENQFYLLSMATSASRKEILDVSLLRYFGGWLVNATATAEACAALFHVPGMTGWCPMHLEGMDQLNNYYNQIPFQEVAQYASNRLREWRSRRGDPSFVAAPFAMAIPNAIYLDTLDANGTIRTGTEIFPPSWGPPSAAASSSLSPPSLPRYAYADTVLLVNVMRACVGQSVTGSATLTTLCDSLTDDLVARWRRNPLQRWSDVEHGRHEVWPLNQ